MALLGTYINSGAACLAGGQSCFAHGLPTTPDFASFTQITDGAANVCFPVQVSRGTVGVFVLGKLANGTNAEGLFQAFNAIIR